VPPVECTSHRHRTLGAESTEGCIGEPLVMDEYDSYRPERGLSVAEPAAEFVAIRDNTLAKPNSWPLLPISLLPI